MKKFLKRKGLIIGIAALIISAVTVISMYYTADRSSVFGNAAGVVMRPVENGIRGAVDLLEKLYGYLYQYDLLTEENAALREENGRLAELERDAEAALDENAALREQLGLKEQTRTYSTVNASVTSWTASNWSSSFTINKGTTSDIAVDDPVIDSAGNLVGRVAEAGTSWATVATVVDTSSSMGAVVSGVSAVAAGDFTLMRDGQLMLTFVPSGSALFAGDTVTTSGDGGIFPKGLVIGEIADVRQSESGATEYAVIAPATDFTTLNLVFVVKEFELIE